METFAAIPLKGLGPVALGMTRAEVYDVLGPPPATFRKAASAAHPTDAWHENAFQVFYEGAEPTVAYIEAADSPEFDVNLFGYSVFREPADALAAAVSLVSPADTADPEYGCSFIFRDLSLSLWRPLADQTAFSTVGVGRPGYYEDAA